MPESVTDRPTKSHEYIFLLAKSQRYYFDMDAVREPHARLWDESNGGNMAHVTNEALAHGSGWCHRGDYPLPNPNGRNIRTVWTIATHPYPEAHFATFPPKLIEPCIKAGCPEGATVLDPFLGSGTTAEVARKLGRNSIGFELNEGYRPLIEDRLKQGVLL
jgi:site-specific DNA-methyltransferase (cytosine-N4-specific)